jgi:hypothetical protein
MVQVFFMHFPLLPLLSYEDKVEAGEGGLDTLGLVQVAEDVVGPAPVAPLNIALKTNGTTLPYMFRPYP